ncbi:hypothetical protein TG4357_01814 [Thalassovita gelatinovora]|uniref:Uncharacterized protein n=1 Tax=Thalassovita gelatinovora TaxID=53501 RepID=A0A0P1FW75_THAGE|nr:hypothetical protein [Thalassovita gelatinovora]QIZ80731.1 hypothetical protein HFZ77_09685 [Thalassovita gelatinovora]CUH65350.1 hypothetical protein TG4357_01814 [Thalassovita gelatinovora]SEQ89746.1 hypothetical protein SAMN04488043_110102 [Thalassovita gelatinovora]
MNRDRLDELYDVIRAKLEGTWGSRQNLSLVVVRRTIIPDGAQTAIDGFFAVVYHFFQTVAFLRTDRHNSYKIRCL